MTKDQHDRYKKIIEAIISENVSESTKTKLAKIKGDYVLNQQVLRKAIAEIQPDIFFFFQRKDIKEDLKNQLNKLYEEIQLNEEDQSLDAPLLASDEYYLSDEYCSSDELFEISGWHLICSAVDNDDREKFKSCIDEFGCKVRDPFDNSTVLMYLVQKNRLDLIKEYDFRGIKNFQDQNGQTALMYASKGSSSDEMRGIISYLKETMKVNQNIKDCNGRTADMHFKANAKEYLKSQLDEEHDNKLTR